MPLRYLSLLCLCCLAAATCAADPGVFPETVDGNSRRVIELPRVADESRFMVELVPGKTEMVDCNLRSYRAPLERRTVKGYGYAYYVLGEPRLGPSTLKACPDSSKTRRFVRVRGEGLMLPYNSRLPLVVYVPEGWQLKYRIWRADKTLSDAR
ncbi:ecotin family protein [Microbulbifer litoralis]|uniref:ecotin family protein n=1 Tax=Microbulbifer litoralis TaxID=2933965 RepID=UPI0020296A59|nr:ecotin family protein [Microbulbifer sp. GX H0434]